MPISDEQKLLLLDPNIKVGKPTLGEDDIDVYQDREESEVEESFQRTSKVAMIEGVHQQSVIDTSVHSNMMDHSNHKMLDQTSRNSAS